MPTDTDIYADALIKEGGIILGKTNISQLLAALESSNPVYGTTNNTFSAKHSSGGSSGGEGAIIGAGGSPVGVGTDIGAALEFLRPLMAHVGLNLPCSVRSTSAGIWKNHRIYR